MTESTRPRLPTSVGTVYNLGCGRTRVGCCPLANQALTVMA